jgi:galactose oxidase
MANLGNAWHIPGGAEPRGFAGMRHPGGPVVQGATVTIVSGNQFQGNGGNPGNQLQTGSAVFLKRATDAAWQSQPLLFRRTVDNNKYYAAAIATTMFQVGDVVQYYLRIAYDDHDTTFLRRAGDGSAATESEPTAQASPFTFTVQDPASKGRWGPVFALPNVAIHTSVLPNGQVLMWGRRDTPNASLDVHECTPFVWNPANGAVTMTPQPKLANGTTKVNLFCSGHAFLADGRLLVVGGHLADGDGLSQASLYDWKTNTWTATAPMKTPTGEEVRRWYPTATTLPNGTVLVLSGSYIDRTQPPGKQTIIVDLLQIWNNGVWKTIRKGDGAPLNFFALPLYPRMHVASDGRVFMSGTNDRTLLLKTTQPGEWTEVAFRQSGNRDYCPAIMYDLDKVVYIGGGNEANTHVPTANVEIIDLAANPRQWRRTGSLTVPRRQHNATALPDGTVLVTGGTRGGGGPNNGFNDLSAGQPVHAAESWNPATGQWTELSAEDTARCYHATAVLLPDATVLSAGGGEYRPDDINDNPPEDSHRNAQVFSPPYLFKGPRPRITSAPPSVQFGEQFAVAIAQPAPSIAKVSWLRLASVTHSFDEHQRINFLAFTTNATGLVVTAPATANVCAPGHYMLFVVSTAGVPSIAAIMQIRPTGSPVLDVAEPDAEIEEPAALLTTSTAGGYGPRTYLRVHAREAEVASKAKGTAVLVGITGTCPYGIGACWGGAYEALGRLEAVDLVGPIPNADDSTAELYLRDDRLPPIDTWRQQFQRIVNGTYELRGVEVTLQGTLDARAGDLLLVGDVGRSAVRLVALRADDKIQWNHTTRTRKPPDVQEAVAYATLMTAQRDGPASRTVTVTGPLVQTARGYDLHVRAFSI